MNADYLIAYISAGLQPEGDGDSILVQAGQALDLSCYNKNGYTTNATYTQYTSAEIEPIETDILSADNITNVESNLAPNGGNTSFTDTATGYTYYMNGTPGNFNFTCSIMVGSGDTSEVQYQVGVSNGQVYAQYIIYDSSYNTTTYYPIYDSTSDQYILYDRATADFDGIITADQFAVYKSLGQPLIINITYIA